MEDAERDKVAATAYAESVRAVQSQEGQLGALHTRASFILAAAGIATGVVLGRAGGLSRGGVVAIIFFGVAAVLATFNLAPRISKWRIAKWRFTMSGASIVDQVVKKRPNWTHRDVLEWLAERNEVSYEHNEALLDTGYKMLFGACVALIAAIIASVIDLAP